MEVELYNVQERKPDQETGPETVTEAVVKETIPAETDTNTASTPRITSENDLSRIRETKALSHGQETSDSLRRQLDLKNDLIGKYREMMKSARIEFAGKYAEKDQLILDLKSTINEMTRKEIERVQALPSQGNEDQTAKSNLIEIQFELEMVKDLVISKDVAIETCKQEVQSFKSQADKATSLYSEGLAETLDLKKKISILEEEKHISIQKVEQQEERIALLEEELKAQLEKPVVKDLSDVVARLSADNDQKHSKIAGLKKVVQNLKEQLLTYANDLAESKMKEQIVIQHKEYQEIEEKMAAKISNLESRLKRASEKMDEQKTQLDEAKGNLEAKESECQTLKTLLDKMNSPSTAGMTTDKVIKLFLAESRVTQGQRAWEMDKIEQKKIKSLQEKLKTKVQEVDTLSSANMLLKESLNRSEKDRSRLQKQIQQLKETKAISTDSLNPLSNEKELKTISILEAKVHALQLELANVKRVKQSPEKPKEVDDGKKIELERQVEKLQKDLKDALADKSTGASFLYKLDDENQKLRHKLKKESDRAANLSCKLDEVMIAKERLEKETTTLKRAASVSLREGTTSNHIETIAKLKAELDEKEKTIRDMSSVTDQAPRLLGENRRLRREMEVMELQLSKLTN